MILQSISTEKRVPKEQSMTFAKRHHYLVCDSSAQCNTQSTPCSVLLIVKTLLMVLVHSLAQSYLAMLTKFANYLSLV